MLAAVGEFEDHPAGRREIKAPEIADPAGDFDLRLAAVATPFCHWQGYMLSRLYCAACGGWVVLLWMGFVDWLSRQNSLADV